MFYTIYKITNKINGKIYIGKHQTENINDDYLGSGHHIKAAVKKYGRSNFTKEILHVFDNEEQMDKMEILIVNEDFIKRKDVYNISVGGEGGPKFRGKHHTDETKRKLSIISQKPKTYSKESKQRLIDAIKNREITNDTRRKLSEKATNRYNSIDSEIKRKDMSEKVKSAYDNDTSLRIKASDRMKSIQLREGHRENLSKVMREKYAKKFSEMIWVRNTKTLETFRIHKDLLNEYIEKGFERGRLLYHCGVEK